MSGGRRLFRIVLCVAAVVVSTFGNPSAYASYTVAFPSTVVNPELHPERISRSENVRVILSGVPDDMIPNNSNKWNCDCGTSGCWPGCFTIASASIMKYWSLKGYPTLFNTDENTVLARLRQLFPNMLCYGNGDASGKPSDVGYDAFDVASGLVQYARENGYVFATRAIPEPSFAQIMEEIDAGRPIIGAFAESPWGSHAGTIVGYDTTGGRKVMIVRPNLWKKIDMDLEWGVGYKGFGLVIVTPPFPTTPGVPVTLTETVKPQVTYEVLVGTKDPGFAAQGNWQVTAGTGMSGDARSHTTTDPSNLGPSDDTGWSRWTPDIPYDGVWEAMAWMPLRDGDDSATHSATYRVTHAEGMGLVRRSQHDATQGWMSLGVFPFTKGAKGSVYVGNLTGDYPLRKVWADSVKFVWRAPLIVRGEEDDAPLYLVQNGRRERIPDQETFDALRLSKSNIRKLSTLSLGQYPDGDILPSVFTGWIGQYYANTQLALPAAAVRADPRVNFQWNGAAPAAGMSATGFSVRWSRRMAFTDGHYPFILDASGNGRVFVDGEQVMSNWNADNLGIYLQQSSMVTLTSGLHLVEIEYVNHDGDARITLANLPPNVPVVTSAPVITWTTIPSLTVGWLDSGAPEGNGQPSKFNVTAWREGDNTSISSDWITRTTWTLPLDRDGHYFWRVSAGNGTAVSDWSPAQEVLVDRTPPWAQMVSASNQPPLVPHVSSAVEGQIVLTTSVVDASRTGPGMTYAFTATSKSPLHVVGVNLTWWTTDTLSGAADVDIQARELVHAATIYTPAVEMINVTKLSYELIISGAQQITNAVAITTQVPYTTVVPLMVYKPITATEWTTVAQHISGSSWLYMGNPGSTYEFRVRARDRAGNVQPWYDGYSVQAQIDPQLRITRTYIPVLLR